MSFEYSWPIRAVLTRDQMDALGLVKGSDKASLGMPGTPQKFILNKNSFQ